MDDDIWVRLIDIQKLIDHLYDKGVISYTARLLLKTGCDDIDGLNTMEAMAYREDLEGGPTDE